MTHLSLFAGVGGIDLAAHWAGFRTIQFVEREPFCQRVLAKNFPGIPIHDDVTTFDATGLRGRVTLLSGGFPCQPFSLAGKQRGKEDDRFLWPQMLRIAAQCRPAWFLGENVPGLIALALDDCLTSLESLGYAARTLVVPACGVGALHRRERVFIIAKDIADPENCGRDERESSCITIGGKGEARASHSNPTLTDPDSERRDDGIGDWQRGSVCNKAEREHSEDDTQRNERDSRTSSNHYFERTDDWALLESRVGRTIDGVSRRMDKHHRDRLKALGNAVVPQQCLPILQAIAKEINQ